MKRGWRIATTLVLVLVLLAGAAAAAKAPVLRMATTTSTDNTGLLDYLAPLFQKDTGIELQWVAVGTGKALQYGKNGDVDVLLVHDPEAEAAFMKEGNGKDRREVMYNDFIIVGPASDPAKVKGKTSAEALKAISGSKAPFASRGFPLLRLPLFNRVLDPFLVRQSIRVLRIGLHRHRNNTRCPLEVVSLEEFVSHLQEIARFLASFLSLCVVDFGHESHSLVRYPIYRVTERKNSPSVRRLNRSISRILRRSYRRSIACARCVIAFCLSRCNAYILAALYRIR